MRGHEHRMDEASKASYPCSIQVVIALFQSANELTLPMVAAVNAGAITGGPEQSHPRKIYGSAHP